MNLSQVRRRRLSNLMLSRPSEDDPAVVVATLGAVQAQDFLGALWAVGQRTRGGTEKRVEASIAAGRIVRTWPMRGTLHFVAADDVRWMIDLCTPRIVRRLAPQHARESGLDDERLGKARTALVRALEGGRRLTRPAAYQEVEAVGVPLEGTAGLHLLWRLAQDKLICFGPRQAKQQTIVLLDEWVPGGRALGRDEALAELAYRYFRGHGPATIADFVWWSGLTVGDARAGVRLAEPRLERETFGGETVWFTGSLARSRSGVAHLLPPFDEFLVGYKDRRAVLDPRFARRLSALLAPSIELDGQIVGSWGRKFIKGGVDLAFRRFGRLTATQTAAVDRAAERYIAYLSPRSSAGQSS